MVTGCFILTAQLKLLPGIIPLLYVMEMFRHYATGVPVGLSAMKYGAHNYFDKDDTLLYTDG
jgi:hypothetical protein